MKNTAITFQRKIDYNHGEEGSEEYIYPYPIQISTSLGGFLLTDTGVQGDTVKIKKPLITLPERQQWRLFADDVEDMFTTYYIVNVETNRALTVAEISTDEGVEIVTAPYIGMLTQRWYISRYVEGADVYYYFLNVFSGYCINVNENNFKEDEKIITFSFSNDTNELFTVRPVINSISNYYRSEMEYYNKSQEEETEYDS